MPSALAGVAVKSIKSLLNDEQGTNWGDYKLYPKLRIAYQEMMNEFVLAGVPIINQNTTTPLTVAAITVDDNNVDLSTTAGYPTDMLEPIWMKERAVGQANKDFVDMTQVDFIPQVSLSGIQLIWWAWEHGTILLRGCTSPVQVIIRYKRQLSPPNVPTDDLIVPLAETFLAPETAYMALTSTPNYDEKVARSLKALAERNLENIVSQAVRGLQNLPSKRRPYHRGHGRSRAIRDF